MIPCRRRAIVSAGCMSVILGSVLVLAGCSPTEPTSQSTAANGGAVGGSGGLGGSGGNGGNGGTVSAGGAGGLGGGGMAPATCSDSAQNGNETDVDCGGVD